MEHPHEADGTVTYTELKGDVRFEDVTFGYNSDKVILQDISLFAKARTETCVCWFHRSRKDDNYEFN